LEKVDSLLVFQDLDDDSEAEKLSPLLVTDDRSPDLNLRVNSVEDTNAAEDEVSLGG
jgi:hypothetical protein